MEYGTLIRDAWSITWRYRFLWILGLLAGGSSVMPPTGGGGPPGGHSSHGAPQLDPVLDGTLKGLAPWAAANVPLLVALAGFALLCLLAFVVASFIARGGMAQATTDLATGGTTSFGSAWRAGTHLFWRYVGLTLLLVGGALAVLAAIAAVVGALALIGTVGKSPVTAGLIAVALALAALACFVRYVLRLSRASTVPHWLVAVAATLFAVPVLVTVLVVGTLALSLVVVFAQRAIAAEDLGPIDALRSGWRLMRAHVGESLVTWLINAVLALVSNVAGIAGALFGLALLAPAGAALFATNGVGAPLLTYAGFGGLLLIVGVLTLIGIVNTFFWSYWTLVYVRLSAAPR